MHFKETKHENLMDDDPFRFRAILTFHCIGDFPADYYPSLPRHFRFWCSGDIADEDDGVALSSNDDLAGLLIDEARRNCKKNTSEHL